MRCVKANGRSAEAWAILHERIRAITAVGGALILIGAVTATLARPSPPSEQPVP